MNKPESFIKPVLQTTEFQRENTDITGSKDEHLQLAQNAAEGSSSLSYEGADIDEIDRQLMLEFIKLAKFNINMHQEVNQHQWWRKWTYPALRQGGTAAVFAGTIIDISQRGRALHDPRLNSRRTRRYRLNTALTGNIVSGSASALELAQNTYMAWQARKHGFSLRDSERYVKNSFVRTEELLQERKKQVAAETSQRKRHVRELEAKLLEQMRGQLHYEFRKWSCNSRDIFWRENSFYIIDSLQNFCSAVSALCALQSFYDPSWRGSSAIYALVSNSAATVNPPVSAFVGFCIRKYQKYKLARELPVLRPWMPAGTSLEELKKLQVDSDEKQAKRLEKAIFFSQNAERIDEMIDLEVGHINRLRTIAQQQAISGPVIGLATVARSICLTTAYYGYREYPRAANQINFAGRIPQAAGQAYALIDTPLTLVKSVIANKNLAERHELPSQILNQRMKELDELEEQLKKNNNKP